MYNVKAIELSQLSNLNFSTLSLTEIKEIKNFVKTNKKQLKKALKSKLLKKLCNVDKKLKLKLKLKKVVAIIKEATNTDAAFDNIKDLALKIKGDLLDKLEDKNVTTAVFEMAHNLFCNKSDKNITDPFPTSSSDPMQDDAGSSDADADVALALDVVEYLDVLKFVSLDDFQGGERKYMEELLRLEERLETEGAENLNDLSRGFASPHPEVSQNERNNLPLIFGIANDKDWKQFALKKCKDKKKKKLKKCNKDKKSKGHSKGQQFHLRWDFLDEEQGWRRRDDIETLTFLQTEILRGQTNNNREMYGEIIIYLLSVRLREFNTMRDSHNL